MAQLSEHAVRKTARYFREAQPDLIYCRFAWNAVELLDVLDRLDSAIPFVFQAAGSDINSACAFGDDYVARLRRAFERASIVLTVSDFMSEQVIALGAPRSKVRRHYVGVAIPRERAAAKTHTATYSILAVSRLAEVKGLQYTIRAFARARESAPNAVLHIIGDGPDRDQCTRLAIELGISDLVILHGSKSPEETHNAMCQADLFVQHNVKTAEGQQEGFGLSVAEAAAHGLPAVGTWSGGIPEVVIDGETGWLVQPGDEVGMAHAMVSLFEDPCRRSKMGEAARQRALELFDQERQNKLLEAILLDASRSQVTLPVDADGRIVGVQGAQ
jgi:glycosyltransferase involved in cell wall biosynthesis